MVHKQATNSATKIAAPNKNMHNKKPRNNAYDWIATRYIFLCFKSLNNRNEFNENSVGVLKNNVIWTITSIVPACGTIFVDSLISL